MPTEHLSAEEIAARQLTACLKLWHAGDYLSALTLAGAAEEILGKRLRRVGKEPSFDNVKKTVIAFARHLGEESPDIDQIVADLLNQTRNELKHYAGDDSLAFDLREDASDMIERALTNYQLLTGTLFDGAMEFWGSDSDT